MKLMHKIQIATLEWNFKKIYEYLSYNVKMVNFIVVIGQKASCEKCTTAGVFV